MRRTWFPLLLAGLLTACGASADDDRVVQEEASGAVDTRQALVDLVYSDLLVSGEDDPNALHLSDGEAECVATYFVGEFGVEHLEELGYDIDTGDVPPEPLFDIPVAADQQAATVEATKGCVDFRAHTRTFVAGDTRLTEPEVDCLTPGFLETGLLEQSLFAPDGEMSREELRAIFVPIYASCGIDLEEVQRREP